MILETNNVKMNPFLQEMGPNKPTMFQIKILYD